VAVEKRFPLLRGAQRPNFGGFVKSFLENSRNFNAKIVPASRTAVGGMAKKENLKPSILLGFEILKMHICIGFQNLVHNQ